MLHNISVLYIEDDLDIADEVIFFLEKKVSFIHHISNGEEGLKCFKEHAPDIIITDIQMPKMNGLDMITLIRKENSQIPIIITSAFNETEKLLRAIDLGVDSYMLKPVNLKDLVDKIQKLLTPIYLSKELEKSKAELAMMDELQAKERELSAYKERMDYAFTGSNDGLWDWDILTGANYFSPRWKEIIGYTDEEIDNSIESGLNTVYPDDIPLIEQAIEKSFGPQRADYAVEFRQIHKDGHLVWVLTRGVVKFDEMGNPIRMIGTHTDITEIKEAIDARKNLLEEQNVLLSLFDKGDSVLFKWKNDANLSIEYVSKSVKPLLGYEVNELVALKGTFVSCIHKDDQQQIMKEVSDATNEKVDFFKHQVYRLITKDKQLKWVMGYTMIQRDNKNNITNFVGYITDVSELKNTHTKLEKLSITDELTKLYNRRYFNEVVIKEINRSKRNKKSLAFLMLDIDFFKLYNDNYGHLQGDIALSQVAKVLKSLTNREGDYAFRLGGEEFGAIFMYENPEDVKNYANNLLHSIENLNIPHKHNTVSKYITASIGVVIKKYDDDLSVDELYAQADKMLYKAKSFGRNQVQL